MSTDFTGMNSEKIDKLVATIIELRTTVRILLAVVAIALPMMVGLLTFLVVQSFSTASKVDRLSDQIASVRSDYAQLAQRLEKLEGGRRP